MKARAQKVSAIHIPSITWLMLCDDPELQLSPEQQLSISVVAHDPADEEHEGTSCGLLPQPDIFGALHLL